MWRVQGGFRERKREIEKLEERQLHLSKARQNASRIVRYYEKKSKKLEERCSETTVDCDNEGDGPDDTRIAELQAKLSEADLLICSLEEQVNDLLAAANEDEVVTFADGKYTDEMRQCCISLLAQNVGVNNVNNIITEVLRLSGKRPSRLPSRTLLEQMVFEGRAMSLVHISDLASTTEASTLHYDGTTKFGRKYGGFQLTTSSGQYTLSINDLESGSAEHTLDLLKQVIEEVTLAGQKATGKALTGEKLISSLKNTMTDRASVNTRFNELLEHYRENILSATKECWEEMSHEEKNQWQN